MVSQETSLLGCEVENCPLEQELHETDSRFRLVVRGLVGDVLLEKDDCTSETLVQDIMRQIVQGLEEPKVLQLCSGPTVLRPSARICDYRAGEGLELTCLKFQGSGLGKTFGCGPGADFVSSWAMFGAASVGKSCLRVQFADRIFPPRGPTLTGYVNSRIVCVGGALVKMLLQEADGPEFHHWHGHHFHGAFIVYDVTRRSSFELVPSLFLDVRSSCTINSAMVLLGNKADKDCERQVSYAEGDNLANNLGLLFMETSALVEAMVDEAFLTACEAACLC